jgi:heme/copper-type cytochrome/quinol oxidase subunit 4
MLSSSLDPGRALRFCVIGFVLELLLTAVPFALIATRLLEPARRSSSSRSWAIVQIACIRAIFCTSIWRRRYAPNCSY